MLEDKDSLPGRRQFLQTSAALASVLPLAAADSTAAGIEPPRVPIALYRAIADDRFPLALAWAAHMREQEQSIAIIRNGDITPIWYNDLYQRWTRGPVAMAGLTAHGPLFCLERLAWDHGMRVAARVPVSPDASVDAMNWMTHSPERWLEVAAQPATSADLPEDTLYAWVIAPKALLPTNGDRS